MEIVIESEPYRSSASNANPAYLRSPVTSQQPVISTNSAFYYATLPRGGGLRASPTAEMLDGASTTTSVRRVDKSGLLEIAELEPGRQPLPGRHLTGAESGHGTLSRRIERSGLLEAVPELPDQCHRTGLASEELLAAAATARSMVERQQHLLGAETDIVESSLLRRSFANEAHESSPGPNHNENETTGNRPRVKFAPDDSICSSTVIQPPSPDPETVKEQPACRKPSVVDCLGRLSPRQRDNRHVQMTLSNIPDVIEAHGNSDATTTTTTTATGTKQPEGERAEAEGCEHTAIQSVEEARVAYKAAGTGTTGNKINHNDNIQAVHVIILSEQL